MSKVIDKPLNATDYMDIAANNYASELNIFRAIPDIRDGLKPVQRDIVVGLNDLGYSHTKPHKKGHEATDGRHAKLRAAFARDGHGRAHTKR